MSASYVNLHHMSITHMSFVIGCHGPSLPSISAMRSPANLLAPLDIMIDILLTSTQRQRRGQVPGASDAENRGMLKSGIRIASR